MIKYSIFLLKNDHFDSISLKKSLKTETLEQVIVGRDSLNIIINRLHVFGPPWGRGGEGAGVKGWYLVLAHIYIYTYTYMYIYA